MSPTPRPPTPPHRAQQTRAYVVMGLGLLGMGFSGIFVSLAGAPGAVAGFYRMIVAVVLLAPRGLLGWVERIGRRGNGDRDGT